MKKRSAPKVRLNLEISEKTKEQLDNLMQRSGAASCVEVIRRALAIYDLIVTEDENGSAIIIRGNHGDERLKVI